MVLNTCPNALKAQRELMAKLVYAQSLSTEDRALADGLLDWLQEVSDNYFYFEQKSIEINFTPDL